MELIIDFYKGLDTLNLIIFWGIIVVIILLLIFSSIKINKNKRLKKIVEKNNKYEEDIPIKKESQSTMLNITENISKELEDVQIENKEEISKQENANSPIEEEKFIAEEHVISYQQEQNINLQDDNSKEQQLNKEQKQIEMPTGPYQRNVLREMSLSQTSPIGINRQIRNEEKKIEMVKDLEQSLSNKQENNIEQKQEELKIKYIENKTQELNSQIKQELTNIEKTLPRRTEIINETSIKNTNENSEKKHRQEQLKEIYKTEVKNKIDSVSKELLNISSKITDIKEEKSSSEKYLEEVSRKLAEAEIPDEIERTIYELQQEEDAIISYKELMEKKDSIQTIDEEDAIISIEELMNKKNEESVKQENSKLYNLTESEENEDFIKELKQFRNDL